jgi:hypothetical protein
MHLLGKTRAGGGITGNQDGRIERLQRRHGIAGRLGCLNLGDLLLRQFKIAEAGCQKQFRSSRQQS